MAELFLEYKLGMEPSIAKKYKHRAAKWYRAKHLAAMDGIVFKDTKPIKDFKEGYERAKVAAKITGNSISKDATKAKEKVKAAKIGDKIKGFWGKVTGKNKKNAQEEEAVVNEEPEPEKTGFQAIAIVPTQTEEKPNESEN